MKTLNDYPEASRCRRGLHDWRTTKNDGVWFREDCVKCGKHLVWKVGVGGKDRKWLDAHARDALQPYGQDRDIFIAEYGLDAYKRIVEAHRGQKTDWDSITDEAKEDIKASKRQTFV